jgi:hypothetical protein
LAPRGDACLTKQCLFAALLGSLYVARHRRPSTHFHTKPCRGPFHLAATMCCPHRGHCSPSATCPLHYGLKPKGTRRLSSTTVALFYLLVSPFSSPLLH